MGKNSGDKKGVLDRFLPYERQIRGFFQRRLRHAPDSEDLTQEVFLRAFKVAEHEEIENPRAFLFAVARNIILNDMAKKSRSIVDAIEDLSPSQDYPSEVSTEDNVFAREKWRIFAKAAADLPAQCQKVFVLKKVYGFSNKEIAASLKISTSTVEKHIASGLRRVREAMMEEKNDSGVEATVAELKRK